MKEVYDFIKECGTYYLDTVEGDQPRVRPFGTIDIFEDKLYVQTEKLKKYQSRCKLIPRLSCVVSRMANGFVSPEN